MKIYIGKEGLEFLHRMVVIIWDELFNEIQDGQKWRLN